MQRNLVASDLNNYCLRKAVIVILLLVQVWLLLNLSKYAVGRNEGGGDSKKASEISVDFEFDEESFIRTKEKISEEVLSEYNQDPQEAFRNLRQKLSREERNINRFRKDIESIKTVLPKPEKSILSQLTGFMSHGSRSKRSSDLNECPAEPPNLLGDILIEEKHIPDLQPNTKDFSAWYGPLLEGGIFVTPECKAKQRVAIIIPFRDREEHLQIWLYNMHPILQRQQIDYQIFVVEQGESYNFNRGALMNVGYREAQASDMDFNCFIFQDVDLIPESDRNLYTCMEGNLVKHLAVAVSKWKYKLIYDSYFGGVSALSKEQYKRINGFANRFYGWGGEDDDFYRRISRQNLTIFRYPGYRSRYTMLRHNFVQSDEEAVSEMTKESKEGHLSEDGLSNLKYKKILDKRYPLATRLTVELPPPPITMKKKSKNILNSSAALLFNGLNGLVNSVANKYIKSSPEEETDMIY